MFSHQTITKNLLTLLALSGCLWTGIQPVVQADSNPGLTIFTNVERKDILDFHLDFGGLPGGWDRYRLYIPPSKISRGALKFIISYPEYYKGKFNPEKMEVRIGKKSLPLRAINWDKEGGTIEMELEEPLQVTKNSKKIEIVLSDVKNPNDGGTYYFNCRIIPANDIPAPLSLGYWILSINR